MSYRPHSDVSGHQLRRREQVRHLLRSIGVELDGDGVVPFFTESEPGKFRRNQRLKGVDVRSEQLRTLKVEAEVPAKIPDEGLPTTVLQRLIEIGTSGAEDL
jgi:hypothetical protein